jgi:hypothetical protein
MSMQPLHPHDCDRCRYIGTTTDRCDWYRCNRGPGDTIVMRNSGEPSDYSSWPVFLLEANKYDVANCFDGTRNYHAMPVSRIMAKYMLVRDLLGLVP